MTRDIRSFACLVAALAGCSGSVSVGGQASGPQSSSSAALPAAPPPAAPPTESAHHADAPPPATSASATAVASAAPATSASASVASAPLSGETKGEASYYTTDGKGACALNPPANKLIASVSKDVYQKAEQCGACLEVSGSAGKAIIQVMDLCFTCPPAHLVINKPGFEQIAGKQDGKGPVTWKTVPCPVDGKVSIRIKESSNRSWTAVQIRDSKLPIKSVEVMPDGSSSWVPTTRSPDNYWAVAKGVGDGGFKVKVTAHTGQTIEETVAKGWKDGKVYPGANQF